jgi:hypothetical protein
MAHEPVRRAGIHCRADGGGSATFSGRRRECRWRMLVRMSERAPAQCVADAAESVRSQLQYSLLSLGSLQEPVEPEPVEPGAEVERGAVSLSPGGPPENDELVINSFGECAVCEARMYIILYIIACVGGTYLLWATLTWRYRHVFLRRPTTSRGPRAARHPPLAPQACYGRSPPGAAPCAHHRGSGLREGDDCSRLSSFSKQPLSIPHAQTSIWRSARLSR